MKLGLIGYPLGHSWSPAIHQYLLNEDCYVLQETPAENLQHFFETTDLDGFNVTIPHKQAVMAFLDEIDPAAEKIGAVNTVVHRNGRFIGYNTDYTGLIGMLKAHQIDLNGRHCAVLGSGGVSRAITAAIDAMGGTYVIVSRTASPAKISYEQLYEEADRYTVLINATPVGMSPDVNHSPVDLTRFHRLEAVVDVIANPLRTRLCFDAKQMGIKTCGGFEMLVRQALAADRYFTAQELKDELADACMKHLLQKRQTIVLIGMPTCGKSTIAEVIAQRTGREWIEMDAILEERLGMPIRQCFEEQGEAYFRAKESELANELTEGNAVISCGGGVIKNPENMRALSRNGKVFWIDRDVNLLYGTSSRPLSQSKEAIQQLYAERRPLYERYADVRIANNGTLEEAVSAILRETGEASV